MSRLRRLASLGGVMGVVIALLAAAQVLAQPRGRPTPPAAVPAPAPQQGETPPLPQGVSRGENFSANKPAAALFASDCTGAGCHKGPQGLGKNTGAFGLTSFLRQHYTNSQQSAAALAAYLAGMPADARPARQKAEPKTPDATPKQGEPKKSATAARPPRGKQATAEEPTQTPPAQPEPPAAPPAPPPPKVFDIFD